MTIEPALTPITPEEMRITSAQTDSGMTETPNLSLLSTRRDQTTQTVNVGKSHTAPNPY